jgi:holo-[acyl-carrier protein] synthase
MNIRCGTDATSIRRIAHAIERGGDRFSKRVFTQLETTYCETRGKGRMASLAARFAAKEAVAKALGTGIAGGVHFPDIEIARGAGGAPCVQLTGGAQERFIRILGRHISISLTHEGDLAMAFCVILCDETTEEMA